MTTTEVTATAAAAVGGVVALTFTPADINTAIIGLTALITAIGIAVVNYIAARNSVRVVADKVDAITPKIDETLIKTNKIEGHVNSEKTADVAKIQALENEVRQLREQLAKETQIAAVLAQATASKPTPEVK